MNAVDLELFHNRFMAVAEEMGAILEQSGFSPNIKERRDFSCALFDAAGDMVAHAAHIPVHLGSTPLSVKAAIDAVPMGPGDVVILNDPYAGGTHLPDVTLVAPVFLDGADKPFGYVADRAHHADIGGSTPGSMPLATEIFEEGFRIPPVHLMRAGQVVRETQQLFLANTRVPDERLGDLEAQRAALSVGTARLRELAERFGERNLEEAMGEVQAYSARLVKALVRKLPRGSWQARDVLDDDGHGTRDIGLQVSVTRRGDRLEFDFRESDDQVRGPLNANLAITTSAVFYVIACVAGREVPANSGMMQAVSILTRPGSIVDCRFPSAVAAGNVETSQRIVDLLLAALAQALPETIPAASAGTMNNTALGGWDPIRERFFSYYETVGGGAGAGPLRAGASGLQTHMTNTLNTPVEVLEAYYPLRVHRYALRKGSGGRGQHRGGDGLVREMEVLAPAKLTVITERRDHRPPGLNGGEPAKAGRNRLTHGGRTKKLAAKTTVDLEPGDRFSMETPGGAGWGKR
jgi:N-methylhydantoinase B